MKKFFAVSSVTRTHFKYLTFRCAETQYKCFQFLEKLYMTVESFLYPMKIANKICDSEDIFINSARQT